MPATSVARTEIRMNQGECREAKEFEREGA
jgi:hypothetical protein